MGFKHFRVQVTIRVLMLAALLLVVSWSIPNTDWWAIPLLAGIVAVLLLVELLHYVSSVNRELATFLEFVAHSDFSMSVAIAEKGKVFSRLQSAYELLTGRYRSLNLEKAANHRYLEALIEHVSVAIVCLDASGAVRLMNRQAQQLFKVPHLVSVRSLGKVDARLPDAVAELVDGGRALVSVSLAGEPLQLALYATEFELLGERYKLISFQDIRDELEQREIDYSQRLIKVLTHEIMNSVTPILALSKVVEERLRDMRTGELATAELSSEDRDDVRRSLDSIQSRGAGLVRFVQAYGALTNLPAPKTADVDVAGLLERVETLLKPALRAQGCELKTAVGDASLAIRADAQQIEQVLINLVKNAAEALEGRGDGRIVLRARRDTRGRPIIEVSDNGPGIDARDLDSIFVPFFTTKRHGSGVGLSVSRQIMQLNKGSIAVKTEPGRGSEFTLRFR